MQTQTYQTTRQFCNDHGISATFVRGLVAQGKCPGFYSGNRFYINTVKLLEYLEKQDSGKSRGGEISAKL